MTEDSPRRARPALPEWRAPAFDGLIAGACALISVSIVFGIVDEIPGPARVAGVSLVLVHSLVLFFRRRAPWITFWINLASALGVVLMGLPLVVLALAPLIALYSVSSTVPRRRSAWGLGASIATLFAADVIAGWPQDPSTIVGNLLGLFSTWLVGSFVYARQLTLEELEARTRELEAARDELARAAVTDERLRIARELHDVVAHGLSLIAVQSGVGAHVMDEQPEEGRRALREIEKASRQALVEMRRLLGMLREGGEANLAPAPGVNALPALVEQVSLAGPQVELQVHGPARPLPPGLDLIAYRVVQEALTNVVKHSGATRARAVLSYSPDHLIIEVVDDGGGAGAPNGIGHGLSGMRERVQLFGGSLTSGALRDGGFGIRAEIPFAGRT
ncbi:MAG: histidine kinase [Actinomycetota bacterium]